MKDYCILVNKRLVDRLHFVGGELIRRGGAIVQGLWAYLILIILHPDQSFGHKKMSNTILCDVKRRKIQIFS